MNHFIIKTAYWTKTDPASTFPDAVVIEMTPTDPDLQYLQYTMTVSDEGKEIGEIMIRDYGDEETARKLLPDAFHWARRIASTFIEAMN